MKKSLHIVKIGGNIIDDSTELNRFLKEFSKIKEDKILVHGGGKLTNRFAEKYDVPQKMIEGRRITNVNTLELITMIYGGLISKNIVAILASYNNSALGLSGADALSVTSKIRPQEPIDYGFVGDVENVHSVNITKLLESGFIPVYCAITHDGKGQLLNTNADTLAAVLASALQENYRCKLYYCFEKKGVMEDINDVSSLVSELTPEYYAALKSEGKIFQGMIPKLDNAFSAVQNGVDETYVLQAKDLLSLIIKKKNYGTRITA